jgi:hypothetical protein
MARGLRVLLCRPQRRRLRVQGPDEERPSVRTVRATVFGKSAAQEERSAGVYSLCHYQVKSKLHCHGFKSEPLEFLPLPH